MDPLPAIMISLSRRAGDPYVKNWQDVAHKGAPLSVCNTFGNIRWRTRGPDKMRISSCQARFRPLTIAPFGDAYEKIGTIQRRLAWPLHKDDTLFQSGRPTGLNIYFFLNYSTVLNTVVLYVLNFIFFAIHEGACGPILHVASFLGVILAYFRGPPISLVNGLTASMGAGLTQEGTLTQQNRTHVYW